MTHGSYFKDTYFFLVTAKRVSFLLLLKNMYLYRYTDVMYFWYSIMVKIRNLLITASYWSHAKTKTLK